MSAWGDGTAGVYQLYDLWTIFSWAHIIQDIFIKFAHSVEIK